MKTTYLRKKTAYTFAGAALFFFLLCVIFLIVMFVEKEYNMLYILIALVLFGALFLLIARSEYKGTIELDETSIKFNYKNLSKSKELSKAGLCLKYDEIDHIDRIKIGEEGLLSKGSFMYRFFLNDERQVDVFLHYFGKKVENEIVSEMEKKVSISDKKMEI